MKAMFRISFQRNWMKKGFLQIWAFLPAACSQLLIGSFFWGRLSMIVLCKHHGLLILMENGRAAGVLYSHSQVPQGGHNFLKNHLFFPSHCLVWQPTCVCLGSKMLRQFGRGKVNCGLLNPQYRGALLQEPDSPELSGEWLGNRESGLKGGSCTGRSDWRTFQGLSRPWRALFPLRKGTSKTGVEGGIMVGSEKETAG